MEYILILLFQFSGPATTAVMFPSQQACEAAKEIVLTSFKKPSYVYGVCVPRNGA